MVYNRVEITIMDVKELPFEFLDKKYKPLMHKFDNRYVIPGYDTDDIIQELRMSMVKAQKEYSPNRGAEFGTFLYNVFNNRMRGIYRDIQGRKKDIPIRKISSLDMIGHLIGATAPVHEDIETSAIDIQTGLGKEATTLSNEILKGNTSNRSWLAAGLTQREILLGKQEIYSAITGGRKLPT